MLGETRTQLKLQKGVMWTMEYAIMEYMEGVQLLLGVPADMEGLQLLAQLIQEPVVHQIIIEMQEDRLLIGKLKHRFLQIELQSWVNHALDYFSKVSIHKTKSLIICLCYHLGIATKALENWQVGEEWTGEVRPDHVQAGLPQEDLIHTEAARKLLFNLFVYLILLP